MRKKQMRKAMARVRELHTPFTYQENGKVIISNYCNGCEQCWGCGEYGEIEDCDCQKYPCKTIKALEGIQL